MTTRITPTNARPVQPPIPRIDRLRTTRRSEPRQPPANGGSTSTVAPAGSGACRSWQVSPSTRKLAAFSTTASRSPCRSVSSLTSSSSGGGAERSRWTRRRRPRGPRRNSGRSSRGVTRRSPTSAGPGCRKRRVVDAVPGPLAQHRDPPGRRRSPRRWRRRAAALAGRSPRSANRQLRTWPSAVSRVRSQSPQNGLVTLPMTPTRAGSPAASTCPGTSQVSAGAVPRETGSGRRPNGASDGQDLLGGDHRVPVPLVLGVQRHLLDEAQLDSRGPGRSAAAPAPRRR